MIEEVLLTVIITIVEYCIHAMLFNLDNQDDLQISYPLSDICVRAGRWQRPSSRLQKYHANFYLTNLSQCAYASRFRQAYEHLALQSVTLSCAQQSLLVVLLKRCKVYFENNYTEYSVGKVFSQMNMIVK